MNHGYLECLQISKSDEVHCCSVRKIIIVSEHSEESIKRVKVNVVEVTRSQVLLFPFSTCR